MKRFSTLVLWTFAVLLASTTCAYAQTPTPSDSPQDRKAQRDAERARQKAEETRLEAALHAEALQALKDNRFVLEADQVMFKDGTNVFVNTNTNFVRVNGDRGTVQVAFNVPAAGPNGIGGVTVDGTVSHVKMKVNKKKGDVSYSFSVQGTGISAQVFLNMASGSNEATVSITPNFNSRTLTLRGEIVPIEKSTVFKGRAW